MYETDELYDRAAKELGVTPEALDAALRDVTLVAGSSWLIEVLPDGEMALMVPQTAKVDDEVPEEFVLMTSAMLQMQRDPAFRESLLVWAKENSGVS